MPLAVLSRASTSPLPPGNSGRLGAVNGLRDEEADDDGDRRLGGFHAWRRCDGLRRRRCWFCVSASGQDAGTTAAATLPSEGVLETVTPAQLLVGGIELVPTDRTPVITAQQAEQAGRRLFEYAPVQEAALARCLSGPRVIADPCWAIAFVPSGEPREILSPMPVREGEDNPYPGPMAEVVMTVQVAFVDATSGRLVDALETNAPPRGFRRDDGGGGDAARSEFTIGPEFVGSWDLSLARSLAAAFRAFGQPSDIRAERVAGLAPATAPLEGSFTYEEMIALGQYVQDLPVLSGLPPCTDQQEAPSPGDCAMPPESGLYELGFEGGQIPLAGVPPDYNPEAVPKGTLCVVTWGRLGIRAEFYAPDGNSDPCAPSTGLLSHVTVTDPRWQTAARLGIGDSAAALRTAYPNEHKHNGPPRWGFPGHWLAFTETVDRTTIPGYRAASDYPPGLLLARLREGKVISFTVRVGETPAPPTPNQ